ncbi:MAG: hypothetical protein D6726_05845 [Nitrospirae bacterium]|nr:MAG: hypothetical protein D6726_05845 [Nitrospirota bacterium]
MRIVVLLICLLVALAPMAIAADQTPQADQAQQSAQGSTIQEEAKILPSTLITDEESNGFQENENPWEVQYSNIPSDID